MKAGVGAWRMWCRPSTHFVFLFSCRNCCHIIYDGFNVLAIHSAHLHTALSEEWRNRVGLVGKSCSVPSIYSRSPLTCSLEMNTLGQSVVSGCKGRAGTVFARASIVCCPLYRGCALWRFALAAGKTFSSTQSLCLITAIEQAAPLFAIMPNKNERADWLWNELPHLK